LTKILKSFNPENQSSDNYQQRIEKRSYRLMQTVFEAIWHEGKIIPKEPVKIKEQSRLLIIMLDEQKGEESGEWRKLKGKYRGKLSSADEFIRGKETEKSLEK
jgi:hypothetical protein